MPNPLTKHKIFIFQYLREDDAHLISYAYNGHSNGLVLFLRYNYDSSDVASKPTIYLVFCFVFNCVTFSLEDFEFEQYHHTCLVAYQAPASGKNLLSMRSYFNGNLKKTGMNGYK